MFASIQQNSISEVTRRDITDYLLLRSEPFHGRLGLIEFLKRIWDLSSMPSRDPRYKTLEADLWQHMVNFSDYTDSELLYDRLDILRCPDETFGKFLETCVHPIVQASADDVDELVTSLNDLLNADGFRLIAKSSLSGRPLYSFEAANANPGSKYEIVLSFAGEQRTYVESVAQFLVARGVSVFYDRYEEATLWGKDLAEHLEAVYAGAARYCIVFVSEDYARKVWTTHERRSAMARAITERVEYILPVRFDDTEVPGIRATLGYVDARTKSSETLGKLILEKLGR
jgi:hypothetical protein